MDHQSLIVKEMPDGCLIEMARGQQKNTLTQGLLRELTEVLDQAETDSRCRFVILAGSSGYFCTGMDFQEAVGAMNASGAGGEQDVFSEMYMNVLRRLSLMGKVVIARIEGQVLAGGVGLAAASDLVYASPGSTFTLSEALWGLLPACVTPYLIRRVGFQAAYRMTLTTQPVSAEEALRTGLADAVCDDLDDAIRKTSLRLRKIEPRTIAEMKQYFRKMWIISPEMEKTSVAEISRLIADQGVQRNLRNFVEQNILPWEK